MVRTKMGREMMRDGARDGRMAMRWWRPTQRKEHGTFSPVLFGFALTISG
jgi:hypothetical protein